ncbi:uncharacterized protein [Aegilops tauschii subsp. strangulata]
MGAPPPLPGELVEEILLRVPPDHPACLLRASIICKDWAGIISCPAFRRRLHELHPTPPLLGFLPGGGYVPHQHSFIPTIGSSFSPAAPDHRFWHALDCRHDRALFVSQGQDGYARELLVWEPITGAQQRVPWPAAYPSRCYPTMAAVFCAADGCDHRHCLGGPFHVLVDIQDECIDVPLISVCVYSSETGAWGELLTSILAFSIIETNFSSVLVGSSLLYFLFYNWFNLDYGDPSILEYDLSRHALNVFTFSPPDDNYCERHLMLAGDAGLGVIQDFDSHLKLWTREASDRIDARWVLSWVIDLGTLVPTSAPLHEDYRLCVMGVAEGANVIFVDTVDGVFSVELQSEHVRKVCDHGFGILIPVVSFYTPVPRGKPSEEPNEEAGGEEKKTIDRAQQLLSKGSNATKEGDFVNTFECVSNDHNIRVPCYGEGALEGASMLNKHGCALLPKDSSGDIPKSAPNEVSVKGTTSKDDGRNSTTSDSNVEGAPASEKVRILKQQQEDEERKLQDAKKKGQVGQAVGIMMLLLSWILEWT